jgi:hypothetical protein
MMVDQSGHYDVDVFSVPEETSLPPERRIARRHLTILRVGKLVSDTSQELCLIRNISAGGIMAHVYRSHHVGERILIELKGGHRLPGTVRWVRDGHIGAQFDTPINVEQVLAADPVDPGTRPRAPRLDVTRDAQIRVDDAVSGVVVRDISQGGARIEAAQPIAVGETIVITIQGFEAKRAIVRWKRGSNYGLEFPQTIKLQDFMTGLQKA